jgi:outer membrane protein assembly factor BamB
MRKSSVFLALLALAAGCKSGTGSQQPADSGRDETENGDVNAVADAPDPDAGRGGTGDLAAADSAGAARDSAVEPSDLAPPKPDLAVDAARFDGALDAARLDGAGSGGASGHASVLQHHANASRDGFYVDPALNRAAVAQLHMDPAFAAATISGPTYAQPLYLAGAKGGPDLVIVATEQNHVYAFDAGQGGKPVWDQSLGMPLPRSRLAVLRSGCGNIDPLGVTGTPVIDGATRTIYVDAMTIANANATAQHQIFALDADSGAIKPGWPVDLNSKVAAGSTTFDSLVQNQRGALALLDGKVFVPFGGHIGDCATYHGWIVGVSTSDPTQVSAWVTRALAGGVWAPGGISSDGQSLFFTTGNTENQANAFTAPSGWQDGETIFRLPSSLVASGQTTDYFTPTNWAALDSADTDLGGTAPLVFDVPGATPSALIVGLGKDGNAYLLDRANLGGITKPLTLASVSSGAIITASAAYTTPQASYVVFRGAGKGCPSGQSGGLATFKISATSPPAVTMAWCGGPATQTSPAVSATDAQGTDAVVWIVGSDNKLYGLDGDTGKSIFAGGASADTMSAVQKFIPPIVANGRVFVAANNQVYAFSP